MKSFLIKSFVILGALTVVSTGLYRSVQHTEEPNPSLSVVIDKIITPTAEVTDSLQPYEMTLETTKEPTLPIKITSTPLSTQVYSPTVVPSKSRGYMTTPKELRLIVQKANMNIQPYKAAVEGILDFAGDPSSWPKSSSSIEGSQDCEETKEPRYIFDGSPLVYAKALAYHITENNAYAVEVKKRILDLTDTIGYGGDEYSGANQCILNLSWYMPGWIMAADLIEDYPGWSVDDKRQFQQWLADVVYEKTAWSSRNRKNNWGSAGSATSGMIADFLWDSSYLLEGDTPREAYSEHRQHQLDRMGTAIPFDSVCDIWGIQWYGGIPDELVRGSSGCDAKWIVDNDDSWVYTMTHLQGLVMHAEFLLRRGDNAIFENMARDGSGSLLRAIHFVINNPFKPEKSTYWRANQILEVTYRYYRDAPSAEQLRLGQPDRYVGGASGQMLHFGTITHGFAVGEDPSSPPTVPPP
ncbi:MAG TPA: alginate lyase family protein [Nitrososphaeraceae archaeon]|nr:alginate lyase family protein [Nitrososphaeraceae archaeon]